MAAISQAAVAQTSEPIVSVRTMVVESPAQTIIRQFFGRVSAKETVDLSFDVAGTMIRLIPEEGTQVAQGDVLATLDQDPFQRAVERAELSLAMAEREAERAQTLAARQVGAASSAEDAATERDLAAVTLRDARADLADATVTSPFAGLVAARIIPTYSAVTAGQSVLRLHDMSEVRVEFALPERVFHEVGDLRAVTFTTALPDGTVKPLRLVAFQPETDVVGQSYNITLAFVDRPPADMLPGTSVTVNAAVPRIAQSISLPVTALLAGSDRDASVFALEPAGDAFVLTKLPVTVTATSGASLTIEGVPTGTEIVAAGAHLLAAGQSVRRYTGMTVVEN